MKKIIFLFLAGFMIVNFAYATLTNKKIPVTKNGSSVPPTLQDGSITDTGTASGPGNVGINNSTPSQQLDVIGTIKSTYFSGSGTGITNITGSGINWTSIRVYGTSFGGDHSNVNWQSFGV